MKLQVQIGELSNLMEQGSQQAIRRIPSALIEIDQMSSEAARIYQEISKLLPRLKQVDYGQLKLTFV